VEINASTFGTAQGGDLNIRTGSLSFTNGASLPAKTQGSGDARKINIIADTDPKLSNI
jgi:hypothetical protein